MNLFKSIIKHSGQPAHLKSGLWGEKVAARMLKRKGYKILAQRLRVGRRDEIDIVARQKDVMVFVEVKTRASEDFGRPITAVNRAKRNRQSRAAIRFMKKLKTKPTYFRFDVVEVIGTYETTNPEIRHIENAFNLSPGLRVPW